MDESVDSRPVSARYGVNPMESKKQWVFVIVVGVMCLLWWGLLAWLVIAAIRWLGAHA